MKFLRYGSGSPVFLVHGFAESSTGWRLLASALARFHTVIAPDLPGFGLSASEQPFRSLEEMADGIVMIADELGFDQFAVVGHSMGGFIAQQLLVAHHGRVSSAVLYGTAVSVDSSKRFESAEQTLARLHEEGVEGAAARVVATWFTTGTNHPFHDQCRSASTEMTLEAAVAAAAICSDADFTDSLAEVSTRILVIAGDSERSFPIEQALQLKQLLKNASLCILPGCGHGAHLERADLFNTVVADFLREQ